MMMYLIVGNGLSGCKREFDLGYTEEEWQDMSEDEKTDIVQEILWNNLDISEIAK